MFSLDRARQHLQDYLGLCRVSNLPTVWVNASTAFLLCGGPFAAGKAFMVLTAISMMYCGGICMNDCLDHARDTLHRPDRPLPSGRISLTKAAALYRALFCVALVLCGTAGGKTTFLAGLCLLLLILLYNLTHNLSSAAIIPMAACRFMIYPLCGLALSGNLSNPLLAVATLQFGYIILLSLIARKEKQNAWLQRIRAVPTLLSGIPLLDGVALAAIVHIGWLSLGVAGAWATLAFQKSFRGD